MVFLNSECKYFFALMRLIDCFLSISHSYLILPAVFKIFTFFCLCHIR